MKRYLMLLIITICQIVLYEVSAYAGDFFERNNLAIDGYDPAAYFTEQKPMKGSPEFRSDYQGSTFHFVSAAHRDAFAADPSKYAPQYGGYCAYGMAKRYKATIDPAAFTMVGDKLYLNYTRRSVPNGCRIFPAIFERRMRTGRTSGRCPRFISNSFDRTLAIPANQPLTAVKRWGSICKKLAAPPTKR